MPSATTYVSEAKFSVLLHLKSLKRNNFEVEDNLRLKISVIQQDITRVVSPQEQDNC
jgi:hypothetical protein